MVKNEQDIIEAFVRHNIRLLDYLIVLDNGSIDDTGNILSKLAQEIGNLVVCQDKTFAYTQSESMTRLLQECQRRFSADYVVPLDADEFLEADDRASLLGILTQIPEGGFGLVPWRTFVLTPESVNAAMDDIPRSMRWRRRQELPAYRKAILRPNGRPATDVIIEQGNHAVRSKSGSAIPGVMLCGLSLLHFPVRSRDQFVAKSVVGWMAYLAKDAHAVQRGEGIHWRDNFVRIASGQSVDLPMLCEMSLLYAQNPRTVDWDSDVVREAPQLHYARRYSTGKYLGSIEMIVRSWEQSVTGLREQYPSEVKVALLNTDGEASGDASGKLVAQLIQEGKFQEALKVLDAAITQGESAELWNDWATIQCCKGNTQEAERGYIRALELNRSHRQASVNLGLMLLAQGKLQEGIPLLEQHQSTLTKEEKQAIGDLAARFQSQQRSAPSSVAQKRASSAAPNRPKLSVIMPSNRTGLSSCARVLDACACADENVEVIIRENSGDKEKREVLSRMSRKNCNILFVDPCGGRENYQEALGLATGEFVFCIADDDVLTQTAFSPLVDLIAECANDSSVAGITGDYIVEGSCKTSLVRYPPLDAAYASQRVDSYFLGPAANVVNYSVVRRNVINGVMSFCRTLPLWFSFTDQLVSLMFLSSGQFKSLNRVLYQYNSSNWDTPERALQTDLQYFRRSGVDGSVLRLMWLICGLEGTKIVLGKFKDLDIPAAERQAVAIRWFRAMYLRFLATMERTDPSSRFDPQAVALCNKWKQIPQNCMEQLLSDVTEFIALSNPEGAERYFKFWVD